MHLRDVQLLEERDGDDEIHYDAADTSVDAGAGDDVLATGDLAGDATSVDLRSSATPPTIRNIEEIDLNEGLDLVIGTRMVFDAAAHSIQIQDVTGVAIEDVFWDLDAGDSFNVAGATTEANNGTYEVLSIADNGSKIVVKSSVKGVSADETDITGVTISSEQFHTSTSHKLVFDATNDTITVTDMDDNPVSGAFDRLYTNGKFTVSGTASNDSTYTVSAIGGDRSSITVSEGVSADETFTPTTTAAKLTGVGTTLTLNAADVLAMTDTDNILTIEGDRADFIASDDDWTIEAASSNGFTTYKYQVGADTAYLKVEDGIDVTAMLTPANTAPTATNMGAAQTTNEDIPLELTDIVITDPDGSNTMTATLTLSNTAAGSLTVGTFGSTTSTYVNGVWTASGAVADVNSALAAVKLTPAANFDGTVNIATSVSDGVAAAVTGSKAITITSVNDAPVITSSATASSAENQTAVTTVTSTDSEDDTVTYTITGGADAAKFDINSQSGVLTFKTAPDFEMPLDLSTGNIFTPAAGYVMGHAGTAMEPYLVELDMTGGANSTPLYTLTKLTTASWAVSLQSGGYSLGSEMGYTKTNESITIPVVTGSDRPQMQRRR